MSWFKMSWKIKKEKIIQTIDPKTISIITNFRSIGLK